jgi:two-component system response regulator
MILLDSRLPKVDGLEVLGRIKSDPRTSTIPVVMLTSSREEREYVDTHQIEGGISSYINKPVSYSQLSLVAQQLGLGGLFGGGLSARQMSAA